MTPRGGSRAGVCGAVISSAVVVSVLRVLLHCNQSLIADAVDAATADAASSATPLPVWAAWSAEQVSQHMRSEYVAARLSRAVGPALRVDAVAAEVEVQEFDGTALHLALGGPSPCRLLIELTNLRLGDCVKFVDALERTLEEEEEEARGSPPQKRQAVEVPPKLPWYKPYHSNIRCFFVYLLGTIGFTCFVGDKYYSFKELRRKRGRDRWKAQRAEAKAARETRKLLAAKAAEQPQNGSCLSATAEEVETGAASATPPEGLRRRAAESGGCGGTGVDE